MTKIDTTNVTTTEDRSPIQVDDLIQRYNDLHTVLEERTRGAKGLEDFEGLDRLRGIIHKSGNGLVATLKSMDRRPRPVIGAEVDISRYDYDERGDYCDETGCRGKIIDIDPAGGSISVRVPEEIVPQHVIPEHIVRATWHDGSRAWVDVEGDDRWPETCF